MSTCGKFASKNILVAPWRRVSQLLSLVVVIVAAVHGDREVRTRNNRASVIRALPLPSVSEHDTRKSVLNQKNLDQIGLKEFEEYDYLSDPYWEKKIFADEPFKSKELENRFPAKTIHQRLNGLTAITAGFLRPSPPAPTPPRNDRDVKQVNSWRPDTWRSYDFLSETRRPDVKHGIPRRHSQLRGKFENWGGDFREEVENPEDFIKKANDFLSSRGRIGNEYGTVGNEEVKSHEQMMEGLERRNETEALMTPHKRQMRFQTDCTNDQGCGPDECCLPLFFGGVVKECKKLRKYKQSCHPRSHLVPFPGNRMFPLCPCEAGLTCSKDICVWLE